MPGAQRCFTESRSEATCFGLRAADLSDKSEQTFQPAPDINQRCHRLLRPSQMRRPLGATWLAPGCRAGGCSGTVRRPLLTPSGWGSAGRKDPPLGTASGVRREHTAPTQVTPACGEKGDSLHLFILKHGGSLHPSHDCPPKRLSSCAPSVQLTSQDGRNHSMKRGCLWESETEDAGPARADFPAVTALCPQGSSGHPPSGSQACG